MLDSFTNIKKIINFDVIKCYKLLFTKEGLISNIGSYILFGNIFIAFLIMLIFIFRGYGLFIGKMKNVLKIKEKSNNTNKKNILTNNLGFKRKNKINKKKKNFSKGNNPPIKLKDKKHSSKQSKRKNNNLKNNIRKTVPSSKIELRNNFLEKNDYELNDLPYEEAKKNDKRTYIQYYISLIRTKHLIVFTFFTKTDYNSRLIKIILFMFSFSLLLFVNALFFNDYTMH